MIFYSFQEWNWLSITTIPVVITRITRDCMGITRWAGKLTAKVCGSIRLYNTLEKKIWKWNLVVFLRQEQLKLWSYLKSNNIKNSLLQIQEFICKMYVQFFKIFFPCLASVYSELSVMHNLVPMGVFGLLFDKDCVGFWTIVCQAMYRESWLF